MTYVIILNIGGENMDIIGFILFLVSLFLSMGAFSNYKENKNGEYIDLIVTLFLLLVSFYTGVNVFIL